MTRVLLSPLFLIIYVHHSFLGISEESMPYALLILLVLLELSDAFDGYYARRYGEVSDFGKILDPMADSVARISMFLAFTYPPIDIPVLFVFLIIWRDSIVSALRTICALRGVALAARRSGKIKSAAQAATAFFIVLLMLLQAQGSIALSQLQTISFWVALGAVLFTLLTAVDYISSNRVHIKRILTFKRQKQKNLKT